MRYFLHLDENKLVQATGTIGEMESISAKRSSRCAVAIVPIQNGAAAEDELTGYLFKWVAKDVEEFDNVPIVQVTDFTWNATRLQYEGFANFVTPTLNERFGAQGDAIAITGTAATDVISATGHGLTAGQKGHFSSDLAGGDGLTAGESASYWVIASGLGANEFKVSATEGGSAFDFTTDITSGSFIPDEDDVAEITLATEIAWKADSGDDWTVAENAVELTLRNNYIRDDDGAPEDPAASVALDWLDDHALRYEAAQSLSQASRIQLLENAQPALNAYTGGATGALDSVVTASSAVTTGRHAAVVVSGVLSIWQLQSGTTAENVSAGVIRPDDYHASTNARIWVRLYPLVLSLPYDLPLAASDESTDLATGPSKITFRAPRAMTLTGVRASVNTAPTGSTIIVDINVNGSTILSTKLSIDATEKTSVTAASAAVISSSAIAADDEITIDIDQVGSTIPGKGLKVTLLGTVAFGP